MRKGLFGSFVLALGLGLVGCGRGCHGSISREWDASYSMSFGGGGADASAAITTGVDAASATGPVDASIGASLDAAAEASTRDAGAPPPGLLGVLHRNEGPDERNLQIDPDGTFFWRIWGCDFGGGACGEWSVDGTSLVLTPTPPAKTMSWDDGATFVRSVTKVVLRSKGPTIEARVFAADGEKLLQAWYPGRICASCSGGGPSGLSACTKPRVRSCP